MRYNYEVYGDCDYTRQRIISIIGTLLKIGGGLAIAIGVLMYRNLPCLLGLVGGGLIVAIAGISIDNYAAKLSYTWQYVVENDKFCINIRYNNGEIKEYATILLTDLTLSNLSEDQGYIKYTVTDSKTSVTIKSNKYLYALLKEKSQ